MSSPQHFLHSCSPYHTPTSVLHCRAMHSHWQSWPGSRQACWIPSEPNKFILVSSDQRMCSQYSSSSFSCSLAKFNLAVLCQEPARFFFLDAVHRGWCYAMSFALSKLSEKLWLPLITSCQVWSTCPLVVLWLVLYLLITAATVFWLIFSSCILFHHCLTI